MDKTFLFAGAMSGEGVLRPMVHVARISVPFSHVTRGSVTPLYEMPSVKLVPTKALTNVGPLGQMNKQSVPVIAKKRLSLPWNYTHTHNTKNPRRVFRASPDSNYFFSLLPEKLISNCYIN